MRCVYKSARARQLPIHGAQVLDHLPDASKVRLGLGVLQGLSHGPGGGVGVVTMVLVMMMTMLVMMVLVVMVGTRFPNSIYKNSRSSASCGC